MTSSALFFVEGCLSTGMPRPSSATVIELPVFVERDDDVRGVPVHRLVYGVVEHLPHEMVQPSRADAADVHSGAFADRLEPFENGNVFCCVVGHSISRSRMHVGRVLLVR